MLTALWLSKQYDEVSRYAKIHIEPNMEFVVVQWLSHVQFFETPWMGTVQASQPFTISQSLLSSGPLSW